MWLETIEVRGDEKEVGGGEREADAIAAEGEAFGEGGGMALYPPASRIGSGW